MGFNKANKKPASSGHLRNCTHVISSMLRYCMILEFAANSARLMLQFIYQEHLMFLLHFWSFSVLMPRWKYSNSTICIITFHYCITGLNTCLTFRPAKEKTKPLISQAWSSQPQKYWITHMQTRCFDNRLMQLSFTCVSSPVFLFSSCYPLHSVMFSVVLCLLRAKISINTSLTCKQQENCFLFPL